MSSEVVLVPTEEQGVFCLSLDTGVTEQHWRDTCGKHISPTFSPEAVGTFACIQEKKALVNYYRWAPRGGQSLTPYYRASAPEKLSSTCFSRCGSFMIAGGLSGTLYCWHVATGALLKSWKAHFSAVTCVRVTHDCDYVISGSDDTTVKVYNLPALLATADENAEPLWNFTGHTLAVTDLSVISHALVVLSSSQDMHVKAWSLETGRCVMNAQLPAAATSVDCNELLTRAFVGGSDGSIFEVDLRSREVTRFDYGAHNGGVLSVRLSATGDKLVSCAADGIRIWDAASRQCVRRVAESALGKSAATFAHLVPRPTATISSDSVVGLRPLQRVLSEATAVPSVPAAGAVASREDAAVEADLRAELARKEDELKEWRSVAAQMHYALKKSAA